MVRDDPEWPTPAGSQGGPVQVYRGDTVYIQKEVNAIRGVFPGGCRKMDAGVFFSDVRTSSEHASLS